MRWGLEPGSVRRYGLILAVLFLVACAVYMVVVHQLDIETEVIRDRFWKNVEPLFNGEVPIMEYPPFALVFMAIPRFFADTPWGYNTAYVGEVFVFLVIGLYLVHRLAVRFGYDSRRAMLVYTVLMLLMLEFVVDRYDIFPAVLTLASVCLFAERRHGWAFMLLAVGTLTKLYPAILFPLFILYLAYGRRWGEAARGALSFIITGVVIVGVVWLIQPEMITNFISYHSDRPLQLESVAASIIYLFSMAGLTDVQIQLFADNGFGSDNLIGPVPDAVAGILMPLTIISIVAVYALYMYRRRGSDDSGMGMLALACLAVVMLFMVVNKVFSSQYLIWMVPMVVFVLATCGDRAFGRRLVIASVIVMVLTQADFAYNVGYLGGQADDLGMVILLVRNIVAVYIAWMAVAGLAGAWPSKRVGELTGRIRSGISRGSGGPARLC